MFSLLNNSYDFQDSDAWHRIFSMLGDCEETDDFFPPPFTPFDSLSETSPNEQSSSTLKPVSNSTKSTLTPQGKEFRAQFKLLLEQNGLGNKIKQFVIACHEASCHDLKLSQITSDQKRSINLYFNSFAQYQNILLPKFSLYLLHYRKPAIVEPDNSRLLINH